MGPPEPLTINQGTSSVSTAISDSSGGSVTGVLGEKVYDTATVTGTPAAFTPTGNVKYYISTNGGPVTACLDTEPVRGTQSINTASPGAGQLLVRRRQYLGDGNYPESPMSAARAVDDQPGQHQRVDRDLRLRRRGGHQRAGREGLRHGDRDRHAGGLHADRQRSNTTSRPTAARRTACLIPSRLGAQSINTSSLAAGSYSFEAQYRGDGNYQESPMRRRAVDDQPGQHQRVDRDLRLRRRGRSPACWARRSTTRRR